MEKLLKRAVMGYRFFATTDDGLKSTRGDIAWPLPVDGKPGEWVKHSGGLVICVSGLHWSPTPRAALSERQGDTLALIEARGRTVCSTNKNCSEQLRIIRVLEREHVVALAALAATLSLHYFEERNSTDRRPREAIEASIAWISTPNDESAAAAAAAAAAADAAAAR